MPAPTPADVGHDVTPMDFYRVIRSQIEHEDNLITQRLNWFLGSQSFLFSGYAIGFNTPLELRITAITHLTYLQLIPLLAILVGVLIWIGVLGGLLAIRNLRRVAVGPCQPLLAAGFPPIQGAFATRWLGRAAPTMLPPMFVIAWTLLLLRGR